MEWNELPEEIKKNALEEIQKISQTRDIAVEDLQKEYIQALNDESIKDYDIALRAPYAVQVLWTLHMRKPPTVTCELVVPFGVRESYRTRSGERRAEIQAYVKPEGGKGELKEITCVSTFSVLPSRIELLRGYRSVVLQSRAQGAWLEVGSETKFNNPLDIGVSPEEWFTKRLLFPKLSSLREMATYQSKLDANGYTERFSQFVVEGMVVRSYKGLRKDQSLMANYTIKDMSLGFEEEVIQDATGVRAILPSDITIWVPPRFLRWNTNSQLAFVGTISLDKKSHIPSMNATYVYPAGIAIPMEEKKQEQ